LPDAGNHKGPSHYCFEAPSHLQGLVSHVLLLLWGVCDCRNAQHVNNVSHIVTIKGQAGFYDTFKGWALGMLQVKLQAVDFVSMHDGARALKHVVMFAGALSSSEH
jgi:hypothetical protein